MFRSLFLLFVIGACSSFAAAQDAAGDWQTQWTTAKDRYAGVCENHKQSLLKVLSILENQARSSGDVDKVRVLQEEAAEFSLNGKPPKSVKTANYERDISLAQAQLRIAAQNVKAGLLKSGNDADAKVIDAELESLAPVAKKNEISGEDRVYWVATEVPGETVYSRRKNGDWFEANRGKRDFLLWHETARTDEAITLENKSRSSTVVIYKDHCEITTRYRQTVKLLDGRWMTEREAAETVKTGKLAGEK